MVDHDVGSADGTRSIVPGIERRTAPRIGLCVGVALHSDSNFYTGLSEDISQGGLFVATLVLQPIGTLLTLTFCLPTGHEIVAEGVVRWIRDPHDYNNDAVPGMGVQFCALGDDQEHLIREFIAVREPLFFDT